MFACRGLRVGPSKVNSDCFRHGANSLTVLFFRGQQHVKGYQSIWFPKWQVPATFKTSKFWCTSNFGTHLVGSLAPRKVSNNSKPMVFKMASSGDFQNEQLWCTSNLGTRLGVSKGGGSETKLLDIPADIWSKTLVRPSKFWKRKGKKMENRKRLSASPRPQQHSTTR